MSGWDQLVVIDTIDVTNYTITQLITGEYTIKVTDRSGCMRDTTVSLTAFPPVEYDVAVVDITCENPEGSITIDNITGTPDYLINILDPNGDPVMGTPVVISNGGPITFDGLTIPGDYQIFIDDSIGCDGDTVVTLNEFDILEFTATANSNECSPELGSIDIEIFEGISPYIIEWVGPISGTDTIDMTTYTITQLVTGEYTITVTDSTGCTRDTTVSLVAFPPVAYDVAVQDITCSNPEGAITIDNITGTPDYQISILDPNGDPVPGTPVTISNGGPITFDGLTITGDYQIFIDDSYWL